MRLEGDWSGSALKHFELLLWVVGPWAEEIVPNSKPKASIQSPML